MDKYMRLWNEGGDYLEFPPSLDIESKLAYITFDENGGIQMRFSMNLQDIEDLIEWAIEQKRLIKSEAP